MVDRKTPDTPHAQNAVTTQEVEAIRTKVRAILQETKGKSRASGKPLLVIVGEDHTSIHAAVLESLIYQEAKNLGIKDVALELPVNARSVESKQAKEELHTQLLSRTMIKGSLVTFNQANYYQHKIHFVDGRADMLPHMAEKLKKDPSKYTKNSHKKEDITLQSLISQDESFLYIDERNETIAANLARIPRPIILMTGSLHVKGLVDLMKKHRTHEVVSFNISAIGQFKAEQHDSSTHKLKLQGDLKEHTIDQLTRLSLGASPGNAFIEWAEKTQHKYGKADLLEFNKTIEDMLKADPQNATFLKEHTRILYELGQDAEAGKEFAKFLKLYGPDYAPVNQSKFSKPFLQALTKEMNKPTDGSLIEGITEWWDQLWESEKTPPAIKNTAPTKNPLSNRAPSNHR